MKRMIYISAAVLSSVILVTGCRKKSNDIDISSIHTTAAVKETMVPVTKAPVETTAKESSAASTAPSGKPPSASTMAQVKMTTDITSHVSGGVSIQYPVISNLEDSNIQTGINQHLKDNALSVINAYALDADQDTAQIQCKVIQADRKQIVAVYTGSIMVSTSPYPVQVFFTNSVDTVTGADIGLDRYADSRSMAAYILSDDCIFMDISDEMKTGIRDYLAAQTVDYYTDVFHSADFPITGTNSDGTVVFPQSFSYFKQGSIYFSVPLPHTLGDYVIVKYVPDTK